MDDLDKMFDLTNKKKKKKEKFNFEKNKKKITLLYPYKVILNRLYSLLPIRTKDEKHKIIIDNPVIKLSGRKTIWINSEKFVNELKLIPVTLIKFLEREFLCVLTINTNNQIIFHQKINLIKLKSILQVFLKNYKICPTCNSFNTELIKKDKLLFLECNDCFHTKTVDLDLLK